MTVVLRLTEAQANAVAEALPEGELRQRVQRRIIASRNSTYRRCSRDGCRHARTQHTPGDRCAVTGCECLQYVNPKPHAWRESVTDAWNLARIAWEARLEDEAVGYAEEGRDFREEHPPPLLRHFMIDLRQPDLTVSDPRFQEET